MPSAAIRRRMLHGRIRPSIIVILFLLFLNGMFSEEAASQQDWPNSFDEMLSKNEAARNSIETVAYLIHISSDMMTSKGRKRISGTNAIRHSGKWRWNHIQWARFLSDGQTLDFEADNLSVVNDDYAALRLNRKVPTYVFLHDDIEQGNPHNKWPESRYPIDILPYAFGTDVDQTLREAFLVPGTIPIIREVNREDAGTNYLVVGLHREDWPGGLHAPVAEFELDPERSFLIVKSRFFNHGGYIWTERSLEYEKVLDENGRSSWFPMTMEELRFGEPADRLSHSVPDEVLNLRLSERPKINHPISEENFTIGAIDYPDSSLYTGIIVWDSQGMKHDGQIVDGRLALRAPPDPEANLVELIETAPGNKQDTAENHQSESELSNEPVTGKPPRTSIWPVIAGFLLVLSGLVATSALRRKNLRLDSNQKEETQ